MMEPYQIVTLILGFLLPILAIWPLERLFPARRDQPLWRTDTRLDIIYWLCLPLLRGSLMAVAAVCILALGLRSDDWFSHGFGPLGEQPAWLQILGFLILFDLSCYWIHRTFHRDQFWKFHAVHHSSTQLDWLSTVRHHPVNDVVLRIGQSLPAFALGFSPEVILWCLPVLAFHSLLIHANVSWTFGPLGYVLVSPAYHHWHHTSQAEGCDKNFAEICPIWDVLFGTYYWPRGRRPDVFGTHDRNFPDHFVGQLAYPFRRSE
jgi:sterol desaturase/sphingolipid hydroxylase (fatty acid hydroxylase superfamily)